MNRSLSFSPPITLLSTLSFMSFDSMRQLLFLFIKWKNDRAPLFGTLSPGLLGATVTPSTEQSVEVCWPVWSLSKSNQAPLGALCGSFIIIFPSTGHSCSIRRICVPHLAWSFRSTLISFPYCESNLHLLYWWTWWAGAEFASTVKKSRKYTRRYKTLSKCDSLN